ncbi:MAG: type IV pilus assembly protein PilM [Elusimicrobia bacterium]|nr:type IV pilus assembly protein PilM [Elusimicrobiota bacterium]
MPALKLPPLRIPPLKIPEFAKNLGGKLRELSSRIPVLQKELLAVDYGSFALKIAWIHLEEGSLHLKAWGHIPLEHGAELSAEEKTQADASALKNFLAERKIPIRKAVSSISGNTVIVRYIRFPKMTRQELSQTLYLEAEPYIPFDIKEVHLGFHTLEDVMEEGQAKMETVLVAAKREVVESRIHFLEQAGLTPLILDVDAFALENLQERLVPQAGPQRRVEPALPDPSRVPQASPETTLYLNLGHQVTNLSIVENRLTRVVRDIFISGNSLTRAVSRHLQCDADKAERLKREVGLLPSAQDKERALASGDEEPLQTAQALKSAVKDLSAEVHRSVDFYLSQGPDRSIAKVMLTGGSANLKGLAEQLSQEFSVPVQVLDPFQAVASIKSGSSAFPAEIPPEIRPAMAVAIGLAMRKSGDWE